MNNLLTFCRYYKGEEECPAELKETGASNFWNYEKYWVDSEDLRDEKGYNTKGYIEHGLKDFCSDDGVPITLKALFYNRYSHWVGGYGIEEDVKNFKNWYLENY